MRLLAGRAKPVGGTSQGGFGAATHAAARTPVTLQARRASSADQRKRPASTDAARVRIGGASEPGAGKDAATIGGSPIAPVHDPRTSLEWPCLPVGAVRG